MKKLLVVLLSLLVVSGSVLTTTSCTINVNNGEATEEAEKDTDKKEEKDEKEEKEEATVEGEWTAEINLGKVVEASMEGEEMTDEDKEMFDAMKFDELSFAMSWNFADDGSYTISVDEDSVTTMVEDMTENMKAAMETMLASEMEGTGMTVDQALEAAGMTWDSLIEEAMKEFDVSELTDLSETGEYELKGDTLYIDGEKAEYELSEDTLEITSIENTPEVDFMLPLTLERA